jgi:hypothetical protein
MGGSITIKWAHECEHELWTCEFGYSEQTKIILVYCFHVTRIFVTPRLSFFGHVGSYSCHANKCFVYVVKYSQLHGWNILINTRKKTRIFDKFLWLKSL